MSSPRKLPETPQAMGWLEMLYELKKIYDYASTIPAQMKSHMKEWQEKIDKLKPMIENIKAIAKVIDPEKSQLSTEIETLEKMLKEIIEERQGLSAVFAKPKLYYVHSKAQADAIQPSSAVVIWVNRRGQPFLRKPDSSYAPLNLDKWNFFPNQSNSITIKDNTIGGRLYNLFVHQKIQDTETKYPVTRNNDGEIIGQPGTNMAELTNALKESAGIEVSLKQLGTEIASMGPDIERLMDQFSKVNKALEEKVEKVVGKLENARQLDPENLFKNPLLSSVVNQTNQLITTAEKKLEEILDPVIYQKYFAENLKETEERKEEVQGQHWIEDAGKSLAALKEIMKKLAVLQQPPPVEEMTNLFSRLQFRKKQMEDLAKAGQELTTILNRIKENPILNEFTTDIQAQSLLDTLNIPGMDHLKGKLETNAQAQEEPVSAAQEEKKEEEEDFSLVEEVEVKEEELAVADQELVEKGKFQSYVEELQDLLRKISGFSGINIEEKTDVTDSLEKIGILAKKLDELYNNVDRAAGEKPNLIKFVYSHFSEIKAAVTQLAKSLEKLKELSTDEAKKMAIQINETLKNMILLGDKLEIQLCLKEGLLTEKIQGVIGSYHSKVKELGYDFPDDNRYPYLEAIRAQREVLLTSSKSKVEKELIARRIDEMKVREQLEKEKVQPLVGEAFKAEIKHALGILKKERDGTRKIALLKDLISCSSPAQLEDKLEELRKNHPKYINLLYSGRTGIHLRHLERQLAPPQTIFNELSSELIKLKRKRDSTGHFLGQINVKSLEEKIQVLERLQLLIETHSLTDALNKLKREELDILKKINPLFIKNLESLEKEMSIENRPKTILGAAKNDPVIPSPLSLPENKSEETERTHALGLINERINELATLAVSEKDQKRLALLVNLRVELEKSISVNAAILNLKINKPEMKEDIHLLFEGKIGKEIKEAQNLTMTRPELIHRLDIEINNIKQQRYTRLYLFSNSRKKTLEDRIKSLQAIKTELQTPDERSVAKIVKELSPHHKAVLKRYEPDLVKELEKFKKPSVQNTAPRNAA